ncbi:MAG: PD-(D/E)XK nuclease family protein [Eggerthellaceae bacterium]|nr:PD-(D/E)XK nuclease family protein [Eggerthellaceae bacterium]
MAGYDVVLLPTFAQVEHWRKQQAAESDRGLFSQTVTTFNAWIADLWELFGDGRAVVDSLQRQVIMQAAFEQLAAGEPKLGTVFDDGTHAELSVSPGMVGLAAKCVRVGAGVPEFEHALAQACAGAVPLGLSVREALLLQCIGCYVELLASAGLVEMGHASAYLVQHASSAFPSRVSVRILFDQPLTWLQSWFFESCPNVDVDALGESENASPTRQRLPEGIDLRFGFPSGRYAQAALVADVLRDNQKGTEPHWLSVVACKNPLRMFKALEPELAREGVSACVQAQVAFSSTDFGRQFLEMYRAAGGDVWSIDDLSDVVQAPFSGFNRESALAIDKGLRADRTLERETCLAGLRMGSDLLSQLEELVQDPEADILLGVFEQIAFKAKGRSDAWRAEQLSAAAAVRSCTTAARRVGASMGACARVLEDVKVTVSYSSGACADTADSQVIVTTQAAAARMGAGSCTQVIACDLTAEDYPLADRDDAAATLFEKLGLFSTETALSRARRLFAELQALPTESFLCVRPLNDWDGNPTYPAAVLQELVDAYRDGAVGDDDLDPVYGLPDVLRSDVVQRGEEDLFANASARAKGAAQPLEQNEDPAEIGDIMPAARPLVALARRDAQGQIAGFSPSPSQVESYLECPYKWFVQNRLRVEELEEGFGPLERGSFTHAVLQRFYAEFAEAGHLKVTSDNLEQARSLMREVAESEAARQRELEPGSGRYVAVTQLEQHELQACIRQLVAYLDFEAKFLLTFHPAYLEYAISLEDGAQYAGHPFVGKVDRIDVDDAGRAVIIDYKGSVDNAYAIANKNPLEPGKVQTRMYAQIVRRSLGLDVVGALYVCVGKAPTWAGAYDGRVLESAHLPGANCERSRCMPVAVPEGEPENTPTTRAQIVQSGMESDAENELEAAPSSHRRQRPSGSGSQPDNVNKARLLAQLPIRLDKPVFADLSFTDMLDETEKLVADAIVHMELGEVDPHPVRPEACKYCPVANCPKRGE